MKTDLEPISLDESRRLLFLENIIEQNKVAFIQVGEALQYIRDNRLYRADFQSFEAYCKTKWGYGKSYCYQIIESAAAAKSVSAIADIKNESQARELAKVEPERRAEVLAKAGEKPTAKAIRQAARVPLAQASEPTSLPEPQPSPAPLRGIDLAKLGDKAQAELPASSGYAALELWWNENKAGFTEKQLISMSVFAAQLPKLIKEEIKSRKKS